ncbi:hypothetical protein U1Q18_026971 [Sarracenia purpurea var. burkii]
MGCTQSKIENEETVARCKERKQFMKDAVAARNAFAAAHSAYAMALKNTGAALSDYVHGEFHISSHPAAAAVQSHYETIRPPPPPDPNFAASSIQRATTMPEISFHNPDLKRSDPIIEEENEEEMENESHSLKNRSFRSSGGGGGSRSGVSAADHMEDETLATPPSPPRTTPLTDREPPPPPPQESKHMMEYGEYLFPSMENVPRPSLAEVDDDRLQAEEIERKMYGGEGGARRSVEAEDGEVAKKAAKPPPQPPSKVVIKVKQVAPAENKRGGKGGAGVSLLQIFSDLDDCFLKASDSTHEVSKMLEANRLHYHSNFADNRGHINHSALVLRAITWNKSFKGLPNPDDGMADFDSEKHETHATVLDKMLAWEKKLYDEVKTGEQMKFEYQKKVVSLNKLKKHGASIEALEKAKAKVSHLHTRYIVDMQTMDSTVCEINRLRDEQLYPKLVALVDGMGTMWKAMQEQHKNQKNIATTLKSIGISQLPKETSDQHHESTVQLWSIIQEWRSQFEKLMTHQKAYVKALNNWLGLNLIPVDNNLNNKTAVSSPQRQTAVSSPQRPQDSPIRTLLRTWHDHLEMVPDKSTSIFISKFAAGVNVIVQCQVEEMKLRDKCEDTRKELKRKTRQFDEWSNKYMQRRTPPDEMDPESTQDNDLVTERQAVVEAVKQKLEEEEEAYQEHCVQVREKSLATLKTELPELFEALSEFCREFSNMYEDLQSISQPNVSNKTYE